VAPIGLGGFSLILLSNLFKFPMETLPVTSKVQIKILNEESFDNINL
jgi:hypothetical protein